MLVEIQPEVMPYIWGTSGVIPAYLNMPPTGGIEAEAWFGAHDKAPSLIANGIPVTILDGASGIPFLMKILSAEKPLSAQVHPDLNQAEAGFAAEEQRGIPIDAANRNYRDPNAKPETIVALAGGMLARSGVKPPEAMERLFAMLNSSQLNKLWNSNEVSQEPAGLIEHLHRSSKFQVESITEDVLAASKSMGFKRNWPNESLWLAECSNNFGLDDPGVVIQMLLNFVQLEEGQALHMQPGVPHSYLRGTGVEVMNNSDNVIRVGLTPKHTDIDELLRIADFQPRAPTIASAGEVLTQPEADYRMYQMGGDRELLKLSDDFQIALCLSGTMQVMRGTGEVMQLRKGQATLALHEEHDVSYAADGLSFVTAG